ncbi:hypothetical protein VTJ83DRAFT_4544 [Remersonia thermophila]|uniref:BIR-domain-containing protein n=1 Tax=Remersonia thermophila TaxID=72144 RepID=A0ABR4DAH0_9PEZI
MDADDKFFIFEHRLDSFRAAQIVIAKGRGAPKTVSVQWPHKAPSAMALAKAGFFFEPHPKSPDNVVCFLCKKSLDGWEQHDDPVEEHLRHSPTCGWAIMAAIDAGFGNYDKVHPLDPAMIEARKATFDGRWPYDGRKGFKCKTKKLVEGGWKYTPSTEADDMTTCAYCNLALEGWESEDDPFDEHFKRVPGCQFFVLLSQYPGPKKGRGRAPRLSKASRLSIQSVATVATSASDVASLADITADHDDSVMTTASNMTQTGKKTARGRKPGAATGRKTKAKKEEPIEVLEDEPQVPEEPKPAATRGRKRMSDEMEDIAAVDATAPAPKKRTTKSRTSAAVENTSIVDMSMTDAAPAKPAAGRKKATAKTTRRTSQASVRSQASSGSLRGSLLDDEELDRQLEADLEKYQSEVEEAPAPAPARGRPKKAATGRKVSAQKKKAAAEVQAAVPDKVEIEADAQTLQADMEAEPPAPETLVVPKKGRKAGTRKVSGKKAAKEAAPPPEVEMEDATPAPEPEQLGDEALAADPDASTGTVITKAVGRPSLEKRPRGRPRKSAASQVSVDDQPQRQSLGILPQPTVPEEAPRARESLAKRSRLSGKPAAQASVPTEPAPTKAATPRSKPLPPLPSSANRASQPPPSTPRHARPTPPVVRGSNQPAVLSPAHSPQSSDAENHPPSLQPAANVVAKRVVLAPVGGNSSNPQQTTPQRSSPAKRNIIAGLQSTFAWEPADVDLLFFGSSPAKVRGLLSGGDRDEEEGGEDQENGMARLLRLGATLTSAEKKMTVEEWIYHNAGLAEQKLKAECEAMVSAFEREGLRAMKVLEGLVVDA